MKTSTYKKIWEARAAIGMEGANGNVDHPLRKTWETLRDVLAQADKEGLEQDEPK